MIEGCSNGLNGDAVKHLVTNCFPDAISHTAAGETPQQQVARFTVDGPRPLCVLSHTHTHTKWDNPKGKDEDRAKRQGAHTAQKMFAESILNTVVEVTIYLMPAKLARTSGAGYLVQLFMISSKI